jgi:GNAT superfamily N-acetyltransferase
VAAKSPHTDEVRIAPAQSPEQIDAARLLFQEYADWLGADLSFRGFAAELESLPGQYGPPHGCLLLAWWEGELAGCVGLRPIEPGVAEMKRLFVRPSFQRRGAGRALAVAVIEVARELGYERMRLDTVPSLLAANALYGALGFRSIPPYRYNPDPEALYLELTL